MSSHREAPEISKDPSADNTDVYAFVSPDKPDTVTLIANFIPFELPYGGPNFNEFADDVEYDINISNKGDAQADIVYRFKFTTTVRNPKTFLYNTGPISSPTDANWNRPQTYSLTKRVRKGTSTTYTATSLGAKLRKAPLPSLRGFSSDQKAENRCQRTESLALRWPRSDICPPTAGI